MHTIDYKVFSSSSTTKKAVYIDVAIWVLSIFVGAIPIVAKQLFFPPSEFKELSLFFRLLSDMNFAYTFLAGGFILTIQIIITIPENIKNPAVAKFITTVCITFYFIFIVLYNIALLYDYNFVETLLQNGKIGSVRGTNIVIIIATIITSFVCAFLHSIPKNMGLHKKK